MVVSPALIMPHISIDVFYNLVGVTKFLTSMTNAALQTAHEILKDVAMWLYSCIAASTFCTSGVADLESGILRNVQ